MYIYIIYLAMLKTNKLLQVLTTMAGGRLQCLLSIIYLV